MKKDGYLNIGTIVRLKQYEQANEKNDYLHMIIGYDSINSKNGQQYKYSLVVYPYGLATDNIWYSQEEDIFSIKYEGYDEDYLK